MYYLYVRLSIRLDDGCRNTEDEPLGKLSPSMLERKRDLCQEAANTLAILDPGDIGENKWRTRLEKEIKRVQFCMLLKKQRNDE